MKAYRHPGVLFSLLFFPASGSLFAQGSLTPPGTPAPTMKTLEQIEPRIDLQNAPASAVTTTNPSYHYIITQPGSYYLSANLGVTKPNGIQINAEGVTLDLSGFGVSRASGTGGNGIEIHFNSHRATVRNGSVRDFANGIETLSLSGDFAQGGAFRDLTVRSCTSAGIRTGPGALLESCRATSNAGTGILADAGSTLNNCSAWSNSGTQGIFAGQGSTLHNCSGSFNHGTYGIFASNGSSLSNCSAYNNTSTATTSAGIRTGIGTTLSHCTAHNNTSSASTSTAGMGFELGESNTVQNATATFNKGNGILAGDGSTLAGCTAKSNGGQYGIFAGVGSTISDCTARLNTAQYGIFGDTGTTITNCTALANTSPAADSYGIFGNTQATVRGCTAASNTNTNATAGPLTGVGIGVANGSSVIDCTAASNKGDGIKVANDALAARNMCDSNGLGAGDGAGIHASSGDNRIEGNNVTDNDRGIDVDSAGNVIIKNTASGNTSNYEIAASNRYGPIIDITAAGTAAVSGSGSVPTTMVTADPWANFSY